MGFVILMTEVGKIVQISMMVAISVAFVLSIACSLGHLDLDSLITEILIEYSFAMPQPELPRPAHLDHDSMLSRKFGKEVTNYFGSMSSDPYCESFG